MSPSSRGSATHRIEVEPDVLIRAGQRLTTVGTQLGLIADLTKPMLANGIASGWDLPGINFALEYSDTAGELATALAEAANGCKGIGLKVQASGHNYKNADAASTLPGGAPMGSVGEAPPDTVAASVPAFPNGIAVLPPGAWAPIYPVVQLLGGFGMTWPLGDPTFMRVLAAQWDVIASGAKVFNDDIDAIKTVVSMQDIPERGRMLEDVQKADDNLSELAAYAADLAKRIRDFAQTVEDAQNAIRRILDRVSSIDSIIDTITGLFSGEAEEIARDVVDVLNNSQRQVKAIVGLLGQAKQAINDALTEFQELNRQVLVATFGDDVGNALADGFDYYSDFEVGILNGVINTVSGTVAMLDADTWKGMYDVAMMVTDDPSMLDDVLVNMGKEFVAWDQWSGDHPGRAAGEAAFNIANLFNPYTGGALSKTGTLARGFRYGSTLAHEGRLPRFSDLPGIGSRHTPGFEDNSGAGRGIPDTTSFTPGRIPDSLTQAPGGPGRFDPPETPNGFGGPSDPPHGTRVDGGSGGGGGDDPPGSGGRPVGPPDTSPGQPSHSPSSQAPGSDSPRGTEPSTSSAPAHTPSAGDATPPPASPHSGENGSTASTPEGRPTPSESGSPQHTPDSTGNGHSSPDVSTNHHPAADGSAGRPDATHPPAEHRPADASASEHPGNPEQSVTESHARDQPPAPTDHHQSGSTAPGVMGGMPISGHMSGTHTPSAPSPTPGAAHTPDAPNRTSNSDGPNRNPEAKGTQSGSPENPRARTPGATGPEPGRSPAPPVRTTATPPVSERVAEPLRPADTATPPPSDRPGTQPDPNHGDGHGSDQGGGDHSPPPDRPGPEGNPANDRIYGPHELRPVENPAYQTAVEHALRDADGNYLQHADPRTNDYGQLINDGGPTVDGRSNNCLDCSLSALSSFLGEPTVSAPRWLDEVNGVVDRNSGEHSGLQRAENWIGGGMLEFSGHSIPHQFDAIHQYVANLGPGSAALIHNGWHAWDLSTSDFQYHADGSPVTAGSHATVVVYPEGSSGPVWWDPQRGLTSDHPPSWMTSQSTFVHFTPIDPSQGAQHGGSGNHGAGSGVSGGDVARGHLSDESVPAGMGVHEGPEPRGDGQGPRSWPGEAGDRLGDGDHLRVPELVGDDGGGGVHGVQGDGSQSSGPTDLPASVEHHDPADQRGRPDDRLSADGAIADRSAGTDSTVPSDDRQANVRNGSDELTDQRGVVSSGGGEPPEPGSVAGDNHDEGVSADQQSRQASPLWDHPHEPVFDEPSSVHSGDGGNLDDLSRVYSLMDDTEHRTSFAPEQLADDQRVDDALAAYGISRTDLVDLINTPTENLTPAQRDVVNAVRDELPGPTRDTVMQKVIPPAYFDAGDFRASRADDYIMENNERTVLDRVGGSVTVADDTTHLDTPRRIYDGLRLDYTDTPFAPSDPATHVIRFQADGEAPFAYDVPRNSDMGGTSDRYDGWDDPFTGNGFTAARDDVIPEYFANNVMMRDGAEMWEVLDDGTQRLVAVLIDKHWIPQGN